MTSCEKCWRDAHSGPYVGVAENYRQLLQSRVDQPCTPEQQAGEDAGRCPECKRMVLHQYTGVCMSGCVSSEVKT